MRFPTVLPLALVLALAAGCGTSKADQVARAHRNFHAGCVRGSTNQGLAADVAERRCTCVENAVFAQLTDDEVVSLHADEPPSTVVAKLRDLTIAAVPSCV